MLRKNQIANYLKFGFIEDMWYNEPYEIDYSLSFEDCVEGYSRLYTKAIESLDLNGAICALSGGLDSSLNIWHIKNHNPLVYSYIIEGNLDHVYAERLAKDWGLQRFFLVDGVDVTQLETLLIEMNKIWEEPRCVTGDIHTYDAYIKTKEHSPLLLSGVGSEPMSLGIGWMYSPLIELALMRGEYNIPLAQETFKKSKYFDPMHNEQFDPKRAIRNRDLTYSDLIRQFSEIGLFMDDEIRALGLEPPKIELKEDTLAHALQATHDWYNPNMIGKRYPALKEKIGVTFITPYADPDLRAFCFSMPNEYKFCMGSERHVMRQFIAEKLPEYIINRPKEPFQPQIDWWFENAERVEVLMDKYVRDKKRIIFEWLDFDAVQKLVANKENPYKRWTLLNLSIWLGVRTNEI